LTAQQALANSGIFYGLMPQRTLAQSVQALQAQGEAAVKAMPSIVSLDGQEALFSSTQTVWLPYSTGSTGTTDRRNELSFGVEMKLVPRISVDGQVTLRIINATVSDLTEDHHNQPRLVTHSISNTVTVQDGDYLILGGLLQKKLRSSESGLPVQSGIKALKFLSGSDEVREEEMEVLIMIRPQILQG
jgi:type II secretory pathway component GspD/PulD (secretin)